jgi:hypothetical protein
LQLLSWNIENLQQHHHSSSHIAKEGGAGNFATPGKSYVLPRKKKKEKISPLFLIFPIMPKV